MGKFVAGDVVVVPFPGSSGQTKTRPAIVVATWLYGTQTDYLLCMVSTQNPPDPNLVYFSDADFATGALHRPSVIRPMYLEHAPETRIVRAVGRLKRDKLEEVASTICRSLGK